MFSKQIFVKVLSNPGKDVPCGERLALPSGVKNMYYNKCRFYLEAQQANRIVLDRDVLSRIAISDHGWATIFRYAHLKIAR